MVRTGKEKLKLRRSISALPRAKQKGAEGARVEHCSKNCLSFHPVVARTSAHEFAFAPVIENEESVRVERRKQITLLAAGLMQSLLFDLQAHHLLTFGVALTGVVLVSLVASLLPARQASSVEPMQALRTE
jgi:hypothetical protein